MKSSSAHGFTLIETLLVVGIIAILATATVPATRLTLLKNDLQTTKDITVHSLRRAQTLAKNGYQDQPWGVFITQGSVTLYQGSSYASRDASYDEIYEVSNSLSSSGISDISFAKIEGAPSVTGSTTFTADYGESITITINNKGVVTY